MSEWLLFNANSAKYQLYHHGNTFFLNWDDDDDDEVQSLLFLLNATCLAAWEATYTNFIDFDLNQPELEHTINCTRGEQANYYATDEVYPYRPTRKYVSIKQYVNKIKQWNYWRLDKCFMGLVEVL